MRTVLVTGASAGLGLALARLLVDHTDYRVILTARTRSLDRFTRAGIVASERVWLRGMDVVDPTQRRLVVEEANDRWGGVDIVVNNAGVSYRSVVEHVNDRERLAQMDVNFRSPMELIRLTLPRMREKRWGRIINISSVSGMMAMPTMAVYSASKFALEGATESLWYEVRPWNIKVTLVQPGFINSNSFQRVHLTELSARSVASEVDPYHAHYHHMAPFIERTMGRAFATPDRVARKILRIMQRKNPPLRVAATIDAWLFFMLRRFLPRKIYHYVLYRALPNVDEWGPPKTLAPADPVKDRISADPSTADPRTADTTVEPRPTECPRF
ncbi:MAG: SDR family NAD(P)-dependent oxidoreductase [Proteobacteria bacterium]|nr:SDR family NAD(P)-dependent oxidoreductase [Pseudomonadota bacterium]